MDDTEDKEEQLELFSWECYDEDSLDSLPKGSSGIKIEPKKCTCGVASIMGAVTKMFHSEWCDLYN